MDRVLAVLLVAETALVRWPDGAVTRAWDLPAGEQLEVDEVIPVEGGFIAWTHPVDAPEVFAMINMRDLDLDGQPVPF